MSPERPGPEMEPQINWAQFRHWQIWDPIPWWIIDRAKLERIFVVQLEGKIRALEGEIEQVRKIREIVAGK